MEHKYTLDNGSDVYIFADWDNEEYIIRIGKKAVFTSVPTYGSAFDLYEEAIDFLNGLGRSLGDMIHRNTELYTEITEQVFNESVAYENGKWVYIE